MSGKSGKHDKLWSGDFVLILVIALFACVDCQSLNNGTPIYLSFVGGNNSFAGALILVFSLAAAIARIFVGAKIDSGSRRNTMIVGAVLLFVGTAGAVALPVVELQVVFRAIQGLGFGSILTAASTGAADIVPSARLGEGLGYFGLGQSLGMAIGPGLAIALTTLAYHESLFVGTAIMSACLVMFAICCRYESHPERLAKTSAFRMSLEGERRTRSDEGTREVGEVSVGEDMPSAADRNGVADMPDMAQTASRQSLFSRTFEKDALPGAVPMVISCLGYSIAVSFVSLYGTRQGLAAPGLFFVLAAVTMTAVRLGGGRLIDRIAPRALVALPLACGVASFVLLALEPSEALFYLSGALFGLSMGLSFPLYNTVAVKCAPTERRGAASALYGLANDVGIGVGAIVWGTVIDVVGFVPAFWGGAAMLVCAYVVAIAVFPRASVRAPMS